jgi:hypothetical protein
MYDETVRILGQYGRALEWVRAVEECLDRLPEEQRFVLEELFVSPGRLTGCQLADELNVSRTMMYRYKTMGLHNISREFAMMNVAFFVDT